MKISPIPVETILSDKDFVEDCKIELLAGEESLNNMVENPFINRVGLALAGFEEAILEGRIHLMGYSEINYLKSLKEDTGKARLEKILKKRIPAILISSNLEAPLYFIDLCKNFNVPLFKSPLPSNLLVSKFIFFLSRFLTEKKGFHGTLMDIFGVGVLITGPAGIGKSESSLELISKGHRLISDDYVILRRDIYGKIIGENPREWASGVMEIKSIGIINVNQVFGLSSWEMEKEIKILIRLEELEEEKVGGFQMENYEIYPDTFIPCFIINVKKGRNLALIIETAVKVYLLKQLGIDFQSSFDAFHKYLCSDKGNEKK